MRGAMEKKHMTPHITKIDHVHVYVSQRDEAEAWYEDVLGFKIVAALKQWATKDGPQTMENEDGSVHIALFERPDHDGSSTIAFGTSAEGFLAWKKHLEEHDLKLRITDHELAYSLYFYDPWNNLHEITTFERDKVAAVL